MGFNLGKMLKKGLRKLPTLMESFASGGFAGAGAYLGGEALKEATGGSEKARARKKKKKGGQTVDPVAYVPPTAGTPVGAYPTAMGPSDGGISWNPYAAAAASNAWRASRASGRPPREARPATPVAAGGMPSTTLMLVAGAAVVGVLLMTRK